MGILREEPSAQTLVVSLGSTGNALQSFLEIPTLTQDYQRMRVSVSSHDHPSDVLPSYRAVLGGRIVAGRARTQTLTGGFSFGVATPIRLLNTTENVIYRFYLTPILRPGAFGISGSDFFTHMPFIGIPRSATATSAQALTDGCRVLTTFDFGTVFNLLIDFDNNQLSYTPDVIYVGHLITANMTRSATVAEQDAGTIFQTMIQCLITSEQQVRFKDPIGGTG